MNPRAGTTDLLVFEARPFSRLGTPPELIVDKNVSARAALPFSSQYKQIFRKKQMKNLVESKNMGYNYTYKMKMQRM